MEQPLKKLKKGAVAKLRESYNSRRNQPPSEELLEALKKNEKPAETKPAKKIARRSGDLEHS